jgi:hypothetical protein
VREPIPGAQSRFLTIGIDADARALFKSETPYVIEVANQVWAYWQEYFAVRTLAVKLGTDGSRSRPETRSGSGSLS